MKLIGVLILSITLLIRCSPFKDEIDGDWGECNEEHDELSFEKVREINVPIADTIQYDFWASHLYQDDSTTQYWGLNSGNNELHVFDLDSLKYVKRISFPTEGPNSILGILNFHVHTLDSIFIFPQNQGYFVLIDGQGTIVDRWEYQGKVLPNGESMDKNFPMPLNEYGMDFTYDAADNTITVPLWQCVPGKVYSVPPIVKIGLQDVSVVQNYGSYPPNYQRQDKIPIRHYVNFIEMKDTSTWISFGESHHVSQHDKVGNEKSFCAKSRFLSEDFTLYSEGPLEVWDIRNNHQIENGGYVGIYYDKYRDLVYRVVKHDQDLKNDQGAFNVLTSAPWSILVMSADGHILGEVSFPPHKYSFVWGFFIHKEGILLSRDNRTNDDDIEDMLEFDLVKILL